MVRGGHILSNRFSENVEGTLFWIRPGNDNASEETGRGSPHDAMDFIGVTLPLSLEGLKVIPWGMYGIIGRDSLHGSAGDLEVAGGGPPAPACYAPPSCPCLTMPTGTHGLAASLPN